MERLSKYEVRTNRPGNQTIKLDNSPTYKAKLEMESNDTLKNVYHRQDIPCEAAMYHENKELIKGNASKEFRDDVLLSQLTVPMEIEDEDGDEMVPNDLGIIQLESAEDAIFLINTLRLTFNDKTVGLTRNSKKFSPADTKRLLDMPGTHLEESDVAKQRRKKIKK